jgi:uncharacterized protein (TIGR02611 family)
LFENLKREWRLLNQGIPGRRFQDVHEARAAVVRWSWVWMLSGIVVLAAGIIALPLPGPGSLVLLVGVALLARESPVVARMADWSELRLRSSARWVSRWWRRASLAAKLAVGTLALAITGAAVLGMYHLFFAG